MVSREFAYHVLGGIGYWFVRDYAIQLTEKIGLAEIPGLKGVNPADILLILAGFYGHRKLGGPARDIAYGLLLTGTTSIASNFIGGFRGVTGVATTSRTQATTAQAMAPAIGVRIRR